MVSLVPAQLHRLLARADGAAWLRTFQCVLMGGAALPAELVERARAAKIPLGIGYGMTETAAFVALHTPEDFLGDAGGADAGDGADASGIAVAEPLWGRVLPHARVEIHDVNGVALPEGCAGRVVIEATSLAGGGVGNGVGGDGSVGGGAGVGGVGGGAGDGGGIGVPRFFTSDEGELRGGRLRILGRLDRHIVTGGEKVDPRRVEAALLECPLVAAALVVGEPDAEWGRRVVALVELWGGYAACEWQSVLAGVVRRKLAAYCVPKRWLAVARLPLDEKGKLDHAALAACLRG